MMTVACINRLYAQYGLSQRAVEVYEKGVQDMNIKYGQQEYFITEPIKQLGETECRLRRAKPLHPDRQNLENVLVEVEGVDGVVSVPSEDLLIEIMEIHRRPPR